MRPSSLLRTDGMREIQANANNINKGLFEVNLILKKNVISKCYENKFLRIP